MKRAAKGQRCVKQVARDEFCDLITNIQQVKPLWYFLSLHSLQCSTKNMNVVNQLDNTANTIRGGACYDRRHKATPSADPV